jgi:hypothetical protein
MYVLSHLRPIACQYNRGFRARAPQPSPSSLPARHAASRMGSPARCSAPSVWPTSSPSPRRTRRGRARLPHAVGRILRAARSAGSHGLAYRLQNRGSRVLAWRRAHERIDTPHLRVCAVCGARHGLPRGPPGTFFVRQASPGAFSAQLTPTTFVYATRAARGAGRGARGASLVRRRSRPLRSTRPTGLNLATRFDTRRRVCTLRDAEHVLWAAPGASPVGC